MKKIKKDNIEKNKLKIVYFIDSMNIGGTEKQCIELTKNMLSKKHDVHLITLNKGRALLNEINCHKCAKGRTY